MASLSGKRIAVGGFMHETNTFQPKKTTYADFAEAGDRPPLVRGAEVLTRFDGMNQSIAGGLAAAGAGSTWDACGMYPAGAVHAGTTPASSLPAATACRPAR